MLRKSLFSPKTTMIVLKLRVSTIFLNFSPALASTNNILGRMMFKMYSYSTGIRKGTLQKPIPERTTVAEIVFRDTHEWTWPCREESRRLPRNNWRWKASKCRCCCTSTRWLCLQHASRASSWRQPPWWLWCGRISWIRLHQCDHRSGNYM